MPVVESYPSIVGIAQVAQSAGQGRYNQWLAEYNARSNQMKTNALMSGFQVGSNLGMSTARMWQQQQQFAQRQGQFESQAAQRLQKDTEYAAAMTPALKPYLQKLYPHATDQEIGTMIGSMDRNQLEGLSNTITNAGRATAWHDMFRSPHALRREAENTYRNMMSGREHHNARVQSRLQPIHDRLRNADFAFNESAIQGEIARILQEEGSAGPTTNPQEQYDRNEITVLDGDGQPAYKLYKDGGKVHHFDIRSRGTKSERPSMDVGTIDSANRIVEARHKTNVEEWKDIYGQGYDPDASQVATYVDANGKMWRPARAGERHLDIRNDMPVVPATIPPRPTREDAKRDALRDNPLLRDSLTFGARPSEIGAGVPTPRPRVFADGRSAELRRGDATPGPGAVQPSVQPQAAAGAQPGQVMPQPQPRGMPVGVQPTPRQPAPRPPEAIQRNEEAVATAIQKLRGTGPQPLRPKDPSKPGGEWISEPRTLKHDLGKATHEGLTEMITDKRDEVLLAPSGPIGPQGDKREMMTFTDHMNAGRDPKLFAPFVMRKPEAKSLENDIKNYAQKSRDFIATWDVLGIPESILKSGIPGEHGKAVDKEDLAAQVARFLALDVASTKVQTQGDVGSYSQAKRAGFTDAEIRRFHDIHAEYDRARIKATSIAAAAHKATPPGELPKLSNIPMLNNEDFEQRVLGVPVFNPKTQRHEPQLVRPGDVFLTPNDGFFMVSQKTIDTARRRGQIRYGSQLQQPNPYGIPGFMQNQQPTMVPSPWMQRTPNPTQ